MPSPFRSNLSKHTWIWSSERVLQTVLNSSFVTYPSLLISRALKPISIFVSLPMNSLKHNWPSKSLSSLSIIFWTSFLKWLKVYFYLLLIFNKPYHDGFCPSVFNLMYNSFWLNLSSWFVSAASNANLRSFISFFLILTLKSDPITLQDIFFWIQSTCV